MSTSIAEACSPFSDIYVKARETLYNLHSEVQKELIGKRVTGANGRPGVITDVEMDPTEDDLMLTITWDDFAANTNQPNSYVSPKHELYTMTAVTLVEE